MLRQKQVHLSFMENHGFMFTLRKSAGVSSGRFYFSSGEASDDADAPLDDAAKDEREYVRQRLREELKREPTDEELDEWLRQHTEGY